MAVVGYILGLLYALFAHTSRELLLVYLGYLLSGALIALFNKTFAIRASGHACGVAGPIAFLYVFFGPRALWGLVVLVLGLLGVAQDEAPYACPAALGQRAAGRRGVALEDAAAPMKKR